MKRWYMRIGTISNLPTQHLAGPPQLSQRLRAGGVAQLRRRRPRNDDDVHAVGHIAPVRSIGFPNESFDAVADNGATHLTRYSETDSASLPFPPGHIADKLAADALTARTEYRLVVLASLEPLLSRKSIGARHNGLTALQLGRQPFAAFCPAAPDDIPSPRCRHPRTETMGAFAPDVRWLKRSFHRILLRFTALCPSYRMGHVPKARALARRECPCALRPPGNGPWNQARKYMQHQHHESNSVPLRAEVSPPRGERPGSRWENRACPARPGHRPNDGRRPWRSRREEALNSLRPGAG